MNFTIRPKMVFWMLIICLVLTLLSQVTVISYIMSAPLAFVSCFILSSTTMLPSFLLIWWLDRHEPEPFGLLLLCFFWGAFVATGISIIGNTMAYSIFGIFFNEVLQDFLIVSVMAPIVEEFTKALALFFLYLLFYDEFDNALDGIVYGAICGLGFAWFENISYYMEPFVDHSTNTGVFELIQLFYARGIVSALGGTHVIFSAITGLGFGIYRERGGRTLILLPLALLFSIFAHFMWNTYVHIFTDFFQTSLLSYLIGLPLAVLFLQGPFMVFLIGGILSSWKSEQNLISHYLQDENEDIISKIELHLFTRKNGVRVFRPLLFLQPQSIQKQNRILRYQVQLAFAKWHHEEHDLDWKEIEQIREQIRDIKKTSKQI